MLRPRTAARRRTAPRWAAGLLAAVLVSLSGYTVIASWRQTGIVQASTTENANTDAYQHAAYMAVWETALIQASLREPDGEERHDLPAVTQETDAALAEMAAIDHEHAGDAAEIARRHRQLGPVIDRYLAALDADDIPAAQQLLEDDIEPAASALVDDVLQEQQEHLAVHNRELAAAQRKARQMLWGTVFIFGLSLLVLTLYGWSMRSYRHQVEWMAAIDRLTGLPNRQAFVVRIQQALSGARHRRGTDGRAGPPTMLVVDLDGFRDVNEQLGHDVGDALLIQVADRLNAAVLEQDVIARLGGDEFGVLLSGSDPHIGQSTAARLAEAFTAPFLVGDISIDLEISVGAATAQPGQDTATLLQQADIAVHTAKQQRCGFSHFAAGHAPDTAARLTLLGDLRRALDADEITLYYQPKIDTRSGALAGVEALARWQHPSKGPISPAQFIPVLEATSLIHRFTDQALTLALRQTSAWLDAGYRIPVAVNISTRSLLDSAFPDRIAALLHRTGVPGDLLCIEVTEHAMMSDPDTATTVLHRIRELGVRSSIDDYGTGYSSMAYLKALPVDELKIDQSFVKDMTRDHSNLALVRSAIDLGHNLGLTVVAEGVEDAATLAALHAIGCDLAQGYHLARPMSPAALTGTLHGQPARSADTTPVSGTDVELQCLS
ncbi:bifunctional diguanylate cyclase/phosphodiesterase [Dactylosporangium roseum]|uniref:Bifunctional diguanylate cyclase/phosphodiesterase n=1 Tax=Dactylosporangium roseum TaxID=47989 RepID=A0ABY5Z368_9ACTN|nr:bifunctional diguanylate cyclase/phosphodiesterase [Dactylosporangium roseum]UWZ36461.1 bifunctional diguanylate cyclase/phosphodiesterase [Dactylosporangium roseum]